MSSMPAKAPPAPVEDRFDENGILNPNFSENGFRSPELFSEKSGDGLVVLRLRRRRYTKSTAKAPSAMMPPTEPTTPPMILGEDDSLPESGDADAVGSAVTYEVMVLSPRVKVVEWGENEEEGDAVVDGEEVAEVAEVEDESREAMDVSDASEDRDREEDEARDEEEAEAEAADETEEAEEDEDGSEELLEMVLELEEMVLDVELELDDEDELDVLDVVDELELNVLDVLELNVLDELERNVLEVDELELEVPVELDRTKDENVLDSCGRVSEVATSDDVAENRRLVSEAASVAEDEINVGNPVDEKSEMDARVG